LLTILKNSVTTCRCAVGVSEVGVDTLALSRAGSVAIVTISVGANGHISCALALVTNVVCGAGVVVGTVGAIGGPELCGTGCTSAAAVRVGGTETDGLLADGGGRKEDVAGAERGVSGATLFRVAHSRRSAASYTVVEVNILRANN
jgi:hypothetical protein